MKTPTLTLFFSCLFINSSVRVHRSRKETGVVCFLDPVWTQLQAFICHSFISTSLNVQRDPSHWFVNNEYFMFVAAVYIHNYCFEASETEKRMCFLASWGSRRSIMCHSLISSCLWILPLLLSRKDTCVSLYFVMTSTNFLDSTVC